MGISESRQKTIKNIEIEIELLEKELKGKKTLQSSLHQSLLNASSMKNLKSDKGGVLKECEAIQHQINDVLTDIRHLDKKISRLKHQSNRMNQGI